MLTHGLTDILAFNVADFRRYPGLTVINPAALQVSGFRSATPFSPDSWELSPLATLARPVLTSSLREAAWRAVARAGRLAARARAASVAAPKCFEAQFRRASWSVRVRTCRLPSFGQSPHVALLARTYSRSRPLQPEKRLSQNMFFPRREPSVSQVATDTGRTMRPVG